MSIISLFGALYTVTVGGVPATALYLTSYELSKQTLEANVGSGGAAVHLSAGLLAETVSCVVFVPVDVVKERLQVQKLGGSNAYRGSWDAFRTIVRYDGFNGIYRGYGATLASFGPFSALYFAFYEALRETALRKLEQPKELPTWAALACSSTAGSAAAWATSPLDMAKLRMQVERRRVGSKSSAGSTAVEYRNMVQSLMRIHAVEGLQGLWKGSVARVAFTASNTAVTMAVFERARATIDAKLLGK